MPVFSASHLLSRSIYTSADVNFIAASTYFSLNMHTTKERTSKYVLEWQKSFSFLDEVNQDNATTVCNVTF